MSDNPFSEPDDSDRTVIRPAPGGRRPAAPPPAPATIPAPAPIQTAAPITGGAERIELGLSPLTAAAAPLLQLLARLRNTLSQPDSGDLRERTVQEMRRFEQAARDAPVLFVIGRREIGRRSEARREQLRFAAFVHRDDVRDREVRASVAR